MSEVHDSWLKGIGVDVQGILGSIGDAAASAAKVTDAGQATAPEVVDDDRVVAGGAANAGMSDVEEMDGAGGAVGDVVREVARSAEVVDKSESALGPAVPVLAVAIPALITVGAKAYDILSGGGTLTLAATQWLKVVPEGAGPQDMAWTKLNRSFYFRFTYAFEEGATAADIPFFVKWDAGGIYQEKSQTYLQNLRVSVDGGVSLNLLVTADVNVQCGEGRNITPGLGPMFLQIEVPCDIRVVLKTKFESDRVFVAHLKVDSLGGASISPWTGP